MSGNGLAERKRAVNDLFAGIDAHCEAENTVLAAEDAHKEALSAKWKAYEAHRESEKDLTNPEIPLDQALERARVTALNKREADAAALGEGGTRDRLSEAEDARDEAFDAMIKRKDHCQKLRDEQEARREAEAKKAPDPRSKSDYAVLNVIKATLKEQDTELVRIRHADIVTKLKDDLNRKREEYQASGRDPADIDQQLHSLANIPKVLDSVRHLNKLGDITVYPGKKNYNVYELGPGDVSAPVEEPELSPWSVEPGTCQMCGEPTDQKPNGEPWPRCKPCQFGGTKKPEPDDSGTLFEKPEPEPAPRPVPASTVMLDAKPEADDLAELLRKGKVDEFLASAGHWYSTRFTRGLVVRLKADRASPATQNMFWVILTILEGLDKDNVAIDRKLMATLSGQGPANALRCLQWLNAFNYISWDADFERYEIGPKVSDIIDDDTTDGKEHWHSTKYTLDVVAQLIADGLNIAIRNWVWAWWATLEGLGIKSGKIPNREIAETLGIGHTSLSGFAHRIAELGWITYEPGPRDKGNTRASSATYGFGPRLTNE